MTNYFMDFDDTLFDRLKFSGDLFAIITDLGFSEDELKSSYKAVYQNSGYEGIMAHLDYLHREFPDRLDEAGLAEAKKRAETFLGNLNDYLFPETQQFLSSLDRSKYTPILITVGGPEFQRMKVENSGVARYFSQIIYTAEDKDEALSGYVKENEPFILLEDKSETISKVRAKFPDALVLQAEDGDLLEYLDPEVNIPRESEEGVLVK